MDSSSERNTKMKTMSILTLTVLAAWAAPQKSAQDLAKEAELKALQAEIQNLERQKMTKAKTLEEAEAIRWDTRYKENAEIKKLEDQSREWEGAYGRSADELSRIQEEVIAAKNAADQAAAGIEGVQNRIKGFEIQVSQTLEKTAQDVAGDFPLGLNQRTQSLGQASQWMENKVPQVEKALGIYFMDRKERLAQTQKIDIQSVKAVFPDRADVDAYRLQLGTIFVAEVQKQGSAAQILMRTGSLNGQLFAWNSDLKADVLQKMQTSAMAWAAGKSAIELPVDLLQTGVVSKQVTKKEENTAWQAFKKWFHEGGLVMWPLIVLFFISLLLIVERSAIYLFKSWQLKRDAKEILPLLRQGHFDQAAQAAEKRDSALARLTETLLHGKSLGREWADKTVRQILFREIPSLEKRLSFISSLGTTAPLLGLLGTVSGMVKLFAVITEVGTNDTRILSAGISEALVATEAGLLVAIPAMLLHGVLTEKLDGILSRLKSNSMEVANLLHKDEVKEEENAL